MACSSSISGDATLFRSEPVSRCQLILQSEAAYNCVSELGEIGLVQFVDLNEGQTAFQRKFISEVKRCEEMERKLRFIQKEAVRDNIKIVEPNESPVAPPPREMGEMEQALTNLERDLSDVNTNYQALKKNHLELLELKYLLMKTESFLSENRFDLAGDEEQRHADDASLIDIRADDNLGMKFNITAGVIDRSRKVSFERMLWRVSKGNAFVRFSDIEERLEDPSGSGEILEKSVFMIFFQGEQLKVRVRKICEGYHATIYPCPDKASERREMMYGVNTRLEDLNVVLTQTEEHRHRLIATGAKNLRVWFTKVRKIKAIYHCLNMFSFDVTQKALVAECWMPENDIPLIQEALKRGADASGSTIMPILNSVAIAANQSPPTFNRVNKYTNGFQNLVDAYGVNSYREVNPAVYTIATFPFLFAVMFGDTGHGFILFLAGLWMIMNEKKLDKMAASSEIFGIFFGGRYIIAMMGMFSMYTGMIYNDCFSKSMNIFGSHWAYNGNFTYPLNLEDQIMLDPGNHAQYAFTPYVFGLDPAWQAASNKIQFTNGYKMKISLIFGLFHMAFGLMLSLWNKVIKKHYADVLLVFIPQLVFLVFIFMYLVFIIFFKWTHYYADNDKPDNIWSEHCAPNLLITFINMMLFKGDSKSDPKLAAICKGKQTFMYPGQNTIQKFLVITGVLMVPVLFFGKPLHTLYTRNQRRRHYVPMSSDDDVLGGAENGMSNLNTSDNDSASANEDDNTSISAVRVENGRGGGANNQASGGGGGDHEDEPFSEIMIYNGIHTIEFVLGSVSHTASYLRLWALSLAHSQLSEVLWSMVMKMAFTTIPGSYWGSIMVYVIFAFWAALTLSILVLMEGLSAFLHTLRLHWVEFQSKFYAGEGYLFQPFNFVSFLKEAEAVDQEVLKSTA